MKLGDKQISILDEDGDKLFTMIDYGDNQVKLTLPDNHVFLDQGTIEQLPKLLMEGFKGLTK